MVLWSLIWIGFLSVLTWAAVQWIRGGSRGSDGPESPIKTTNKTAREVLDERLAAGEVDVDEYQKRRAALEGSSRSDAPR